MNKGLIPFFSLALILVGIMLGGCDETGSGGSASTDVLTGEPAILDSVLAIDVAEDRPNGITNTFFSDISDQVYLWIFWSNVSGRHTVEVRWLSPEDDINDPPFRTDQEVFTSDTGEQITWFFVERPSGGFAQGEWIVEIFLDGLFERSHVFVVE